MSRKTHHWAKAGCPLHLESRGAPTVQEEVTAVQYFSEGQTLNRAMRRHRARYLRKLAKQNGGKR